MEVLQPEWATQLSYALECYNVNVEEDDEDPRNINIPEMEGCREVRGPSIEDPEITEPMEKLLKKDVTFCWNDDCMKSLDVLKGKLASASILVFPKWAVEFHLHVDASCIALGAMLTQNGGEGLDHPIAFTSFILSKAEKNYSTTGS